jgi:hypothetical protein
MSTTSSSNQKRVYVVLGFARGGTSAIARALKVLGIDLGAKLSAADNRWNPTGFWEDNEIVYKIHQGIFYFLKQPWMSTRLVEKSEFDIPAIQKLKKQAMQLVLKRMKTTSHWGFKDPRTAKVLPFWQDIFKTMNVDDAYIIALRNPLSSARSYQALTGTDMETGLLLWLMHMVAAIEGTHGKRRVIVSYESMLRDARTQLSRIKEALHTPMTIDEQELNVYANQFLDKKLEKYHGTEDELKTNASAAAIPLCSQVYFTLLSAANDEMRFDSQAFQSAWDAIMKEFQIHYRSYCYIDELLSRVKHLGKHVHKAQKSLPWKLAYPLRVIDDFLRANRRRRREQKRLELS